MKNTLLVVCLAAATFTQPAQGVDWNLVRRVSQGAACAASVLDITSTVASINAGNHETNALFISNGHVSYPKLIGIKAVMCGAPILAAELIGRRHPHSAVPWLGLAGAQAGYFSFAVGHNYQIAEEQRRAQGR